MRINWNEPKLGEEELEEVKKVIEESYINEGPRTKKLEEIFKEYFGVKYIMFTTSCSSALFLAIKADAILKHKKDFEVIVPDLTMIATATAVEWAGGKPILVDVEKNRMNLNLDKIEEKINEKTTAIVPVHVLGRSANMEKLKELAQKYNLSIIEDAAGSLGSKYKNEKYLGTIGKIGCFSLQSNKIITCGQGGMIATNDDKSYEVMERLRNFGRLNSKEFIHEEIGFNLKFNDLSASIILGQFNKFKEKQELLIEQRRIYVENLSKIKEKVIFPEIEEGEIPLWVDALVERRDELFEFLKSLEIFSRKCWPAIHRNPPYKYQGKDENFPVSSFISDNCIWFPNGPAINNEQINYICEKIKEFYSKIEFKKIHEDKRGTIHILNGLLKEKEINFLEIKKGHARGGCYHANKEYFSVIKGKIKQRIGPMGGPYSEKILFEGDSGIINPLVSHSFEAIEDSIVSEWGITTQEKEEDKKDPMHRQIIDEINNRNL